MEVKEEILKMEAGRELDLQIALKVMNWRWLKLPSQRGPLLLWPEQWNRYLPKFQRPVECDRDAPDYLPHFSTSIADAWQVHQTACDWLFSRRRRYLDALAEIIQTQKADGTLRDYVVAWPDALMFLMPEAICKAALLASTPTSTSEGEAT